MRHSGSRRRHGFPAPVCRRNAGDRAQLQTRKTVGVGFRIGIRGIYQGQSLRPATSQKAGLCIDRIVQGFNRLQDAQALLRVDVGAIFEHARHRGAPHARQGRNIANGFCFFHPPPLRSAPGRHPRDQGFHSRNPRRKQLYPRVLSPHERPEGRTGRATKPHPPDSRRADPFCEALS